jgi:hypothetical protein
VPVQD